MPMSLFVEQRWTAREGKQHWLFTAVFVPKKMQRRGDFCHVPLALLNRHRVNAMNFSRVPLNLLSLTTELSLHFQITNLLQNYMSEDKHIPLVCDAPSPGNMYESSSFVISYRQMQRPTLYTTCSKGGKKKNKKAIIQATYQVKSDKPSNLYTFSKGNRWATRWKGGCFGTLPSTAPALTTLHCRETPNLFKCYGSTCFHWHWQEHCYKEKPLG